MNEPKFKVVEIPSPSRNPVRASIRCPYCNENGALEALGNDFFLGANVAAGVRRCPSTKCRALIFVVFTNNQTLTTTFPKARLDFDGSNIPAPVLAAFTEAITCHAEDCFIAAAIMIRKTLEEICHDRNVSAPNLKKRLEALGQTLLIPAELIQAMDELRLLGNDAAHIESQTFAKVSKDEVEIGIEFTKEILKATYQYQHLLASLRRLKTPPTLATPPAPPTP